MKSCFSIFKPCCVFLMLYVSVIVVYGFYSYNLNKKETLRNIDEKLSLVATGVKSILQSHFIDRAVRKGAITPEENHRNVDALTDYAIKTRVLRVFTLLKRGKKIFYTSSSQTTEEMNNKLDPPFYLPYENVSQEVLDAFSRLDPTYISEETKWGNKRLVLLPEVSRRGRRYLTGVEISTKQIDKQLSRHLWTSVLISAIFIFLAVPFVFIFKKTEKEHVEDFENLKDLLQQHSMDRTTKIERKINEMIGKK